MYFVSAFLLHCFVLCYIALCFPDPRPDPYVFRLTLCFSADTGCGRRRPGGGPVYTFNSTELRMLHVEMMLVPPVGGVPLATVQPASVRPPARALHTQTSGEKLPTSQ